MNAQQPLYKDEISLNKHNWKYIWNSGGRFSSIIPLPLLGMSHLSYAECFQDRVRQHWPGVPSPRVCTNKLLGHVCKTTYPKNHSKTAWAAQSPAATWPKRELGFVQQLVTPAREQLVFALDKPGTRIIRLQKDSTHLSSTLEMIHLGPNMLPKKLQCSTPSEMNTTLFSMRHMETFPFNSRISPPQVSFLMDCKIQWIHMNFSFWEFFKIKTENGRQQNNPAVCSLAAACLCKFNRQFWAIHFQTQSFQRALQ